MTFSSDTVSYIVAQLLIGSAASTCVGKRMLYDSLGRSRFLSAAPRSKIYGNPIAFHDCAETLSRRLYGRFDLDVNARLAAGA